MIATAEGFLPTLALKLYVPYIDAPVGREITRGVELELLPADESPLRTPI